jgi:transmembrane sensor
LSAVVSDVNRYSSRKLVIQDPALAHLTYTGTVLIGSVDEWLRAMPREFPVKVISNDSSIAIVASEPENIPPITQEH